MKKNEFILEQYSSYKQIINIIIEMILKNGLTHVSIVFQASKNMQRILKIFVSVCIIRKQRNEEHEHREEQRNNNTIQGGKMTKKGKQKIIVIQKSY